MTIWDAIPQLFLRFQFYLWDDHLINLLNASLRDLKTEVISSEPCKTVASLLRKASLHSQVPLRDVDLFSWSVKKGHIYFGSHVKREQSINGSLI